MGGLADQDEAPFTDEIEQCVVVVGSTRDRAPVIGDAEKRTVDAVVFIAPDGRAVGIVVAEDDLTGDRSRDVAEVGDEIDEKVVGREHADDLTVGDQGHPAARVGSEDRQHRAEVGVRVERDDLSGHDRVDARVSGQPVRNPTEHDVAVGDDAGEALAVEHDHCTDVCPIHELGGLSFSVASGGTVTLCFLLPRSLAQLPSLSRGWVPGRELSVWTSAEL